MRNRLTKKNPFMSLWLSGANAVLGKARAEATAESRRQGNAMATEGGKQIVRFWSGAWMLPSAKTKGKRRR